VGDDVESNSLGERTALSDGDNISFLDREGRGAVDGNVLVSLFETTVLGNVVKVVSADDDGALHLGRNDQSLEDTSTDGNVSGEWAFLVDIGSLHSGIRGLDSQTNIAHEAHRLLALVSNSSLTSYEDGTLLLVRLLVLIALLIFLGKTRHIII